MKAVIYHADAKRQFSGIETKHYEALFKGFVKTAVKFGITTVHCTLEGHPVWGNEGFATGGLDPEQVVYNREVCFTKFLEQAEEDETYLFTEPDARIRTPIPPLVDVDCAMLWRKDKVPMTPALRIATKAALPLFRELRDRVHTKFKMWDGDSWACSSVYKDMGSPAVLDVVTFLGVRIQLRPYDDYNRTDGKHVRHYKWKSKVHLLEAERA